MYKSFYKTDLGKRRQINQDYVYGTHNPVGNLPNLFIVCDGMGGHRAGEYASKFTVDCLLNEIRKETVKQIPIDILKKAITSTNTKLLEESKTSIEFEGMGTTLVIMTIIDDKAYIANVGDSRLYIIKDRIKQVTSDHSLVEEMVKRGELSRREAMKHPDKNIITRAMGISKEVEPDYYTEEFNKGDFIVMCTDGLSNMLGNEEIFQIVISGRDMVEITEDLIKEANENGGVDNIGVIVLKNDEKEVYI